MDDVLPLVPLLPSKEEDEVEGDDAGATCDASVVSSSAEASNRLATQLPRAVAVVSLTDPDALVDAAMFTIRSTATS